MLLAEVVAIMRTLGLFDSRVTALKVGEEGSLNKRGRG